LLAEHGGAEWADQAAQMQLTGAYIRRKRFEARLIAVEVGRLFAGSQGADKGRMPAHELLAMAGVDM
jgi:hypothetical protein